MKRSEKPVDDSGPPESDESVRWDVVRRLGRRYLGAHWGWVAMYALGMLLVTSVLPAAIATRYGALTNFFQFLGCPGPILLQQQRE